MKALALAAMLLALTACSGAPRKPATPVAHHVQAPQPHAPATSARRSPYAPAQEDLSKRGNYTRGGLYAPGVADSAPDGLPDVDAIPEPEVRNEPRSLYGNRSPYVVLGKTYTVLDDPANYEEVGLASFYGNKFHGRRTSDMEVYDMYAFTAAHKTLPLPSYARVTNLANGRSVIVRVNDRGPFHDGRIIDLSYAAAVKLGVDRAGTARVEVRGLAPGHDAPQTAMSAARAPAPIVVPRKSAIDGLLAGLPIASANAGERPVQPARPVAAPAPVMPNPAGERFDMRQDGRTMTADEFDAWLRSRRLRVATGKPGVVTTTTTATTRTAAGTPATLATAPMPAAASARPSPAAAPARDGTDASASATYQVASFAARTNAEHALALVTRAGIRGARLLDADVGGHTVWRLRIGPVAADTVAELTSRIQGLGFGQPQRVRE
jgi:rare lipoprotein A